MPFKEIAMILHQYKDVQGTWSGEANQLRTYTLVISARTWICGVQAHLLFLIPDPSSQLEIAQGDDQFNLAC
ncbi:hypothetical protein HZ326_24409 [Fusarium oxysporum f. sp. albedinis]|nr:hypothetical protein HZ326_24409 [Fusarium oxysporum f. sp. albedinis]